MTEFRAYEKVELDLPSGVGWRVETFNIDGTLELQARNPEGNGTVVLDYIPRDWVKKPAPEVKTGQVWRDGDGDLFVVGERKSDGRAVVWYHFGSCTAVEENFRNFELVAQ